MNVVLDRKFVVFAEAVLATRHSVLIETVTDAMKEVSTYSALPKSTDSKARDLARGKMTLACEKVISRVKGFKGALSVLPDVIFVLGKLEQKQAMRDREASMAGGSALKAFEALKKSQQRHQSDTFAAQQ